MPGTTLGIIPLQAFETGGTLYGERGGGGGRGRGGGAEYRAGGGGQRRVEAEAHCRHSRQGAHSTVRGRGRAFFLWGEGGKWAPSRHPNEGPCQAFKMMGHM